MLKTMSKTRFTLVELLVVIAIVVLLCGLLLPALKRAKDTAKSISCLSNLKQFGAACAMYFDDSAGYVYPHSGGISGTVNQGVVFLGILGDYLGLGGSPYYWDSMLSTNLFHKRVQVARCPSNDTLYLHSHYGWNDWMAQNVSRISMLRQPSMVVIWCDVASGTNSSCTLNYWSWASGNPTIDYWPIRAGNTEPQRHFGLVNVLWGDAHAAATKQPSPLPWNWAY